jgi:hypothetical protein
VGDLNTPLSLTEHLDKKINKYILEVNSSMDEMELAGI